MVSVSRSTPARERADIVLARPPMNIISMPQRDDLRRVFEALDEDDRVRVIVLRAEGEHFSSRRLYPGLPGRLARSMCPSSPGISPRPRAARSR